MDLTQWKRTLAVIERLLVVLAEKIGIDIMDNMQGLIDGTQSIDELEAVMRIFEPEGCVKVVS